MDVKQILASDPWPLPPINFDLRADRTALLIVDMQYHDAHPEYGVALAIRAANPDFGSYYFDRVRSLVIPNINELRKGCYQSGARVIYVTLGAQNRDLSDLPATARERSDRRRGATGHPTLYSRHEFEFNILPEVSPGEDDLVVNKTTLGAFNSTVLDMTLRNMGIEYVLVSGVVTSVCVETTARDAVDRGFSTVILEDACAAWDEESHVATLRSFRRYFGRVSSTLEVLKELRNEQTRRMS